MRCRNCGWDNPGVLTKCEKCNAPLEGGTDNPPKRSFAELPRVGYTFANRYKIVQEMNRGWFSGVWLAKDLLTETEVVLKAYDCARWMDDTNLKQFTQKILSLYYLDHINLLRLCDVNDFQGILYIVMSYYPKGSIVKHIGKMSEEDIWKVLHDLASVLAILHDRDTVHQDIKSDNILVDNEGNYVIAGGFSVRARMFYWGEYPLRKGTETDITTAYMGPELFSPYSRPIKANDIWALGATLFELIEGVTPFGEYGGRVQKSGAKIPEMKASISNKLKLTIYRMLDKNPENRPTAGQLLAGELPPPYVKHQSKRKMMWILALLLFEALVGVYVWRLIFC